MSTNTTTTTRKSVTFKDRRGICSWVLNLLWLVLGGWQLFLAWFAAGILLCLTFIGIPCGLQVLKIAWFLLFPFGKSLVYEEFDAADGTTDTSGGSCCCLSRKTCVLLLNIVWAVTVGWAYCLQALVTGVVLMLTIVGIPFGWQCFKLSYLCLFPFGKDFTAERESVVIEHTTVTTVAAAPTDVDATTPLLLDNTEEDHGGATAPLVVDNGEEEHATPHALGNAKEEHGGVTASFALDNAKEEHGGDAV
jgi:uncharacterized membrane protein YccF (DUF307 family)